MEQKASGLNKSANKKPQFKNSLPVEITRTFRVPVERVWEAWSNTDLIKQWWGPEGYSCPEARIDFREGGSYNFAMKAPDQKVTWSGGVINEIVPNERMVYTDRFTDVSGQAVSPNDYGMPGDWPEVMYVTVEFKRLSANETKMSLKHEGIPQEMHDDCVQGWNSSFNKMQRLLEAM